MTPELYTFPRLRFLPRYLYEIGDFDGTGRVVETAIGACEDKMSILYARLVDTAGSRFFDLNRLSDCRNAWETALKIRKECLAHDDALSTHIAPTCFFPSLVLYILTVKSCRYI